jgi:hypothetical protein
VISKIVASAALVLVAATAAAQGDVRGQARSATRIDPLTASIIGRITSAETGAPLRGAEIRATSERGISRLAKSDAEGRYVVRDLPAGNFTVHVTRTGFVPLYFGQRRPFERRTTIPLNEGERFSANIAVRRAAAIAGRVVDRAGEPVMGARVQAMRRTMVQGQRGLQVVGVGDVTDDTGAYRVYALPPGDYYVLVVPRPVVSSGRPGRDAAPGVATPIFYPGTANRDDAQSIAVDVGGEVRADMQLVEMRASSVSGVVFTSSGAPAAGAMLTLRARNGDAAGAVAPEAAALQALQRRDDADADGSFTIEGVPPGTYTLVAQARPSPLLFDPAALRAGGSPVMEVEAASLPVTVDGDIAGLALTTARGGALEVEFVRADGVTRQLPSSVRFTVRTTDSNQMGTLSRTGGGRVVLDPTAPARLDVEDLPDEWTLKAILLDNQDVTDTPIQVKSGTAKARIVLTDRVSEVAGSVAPASGADTGPLPPVTVIAFADDDKKWTYPSRYIKTARTDATGAFRMRGLPPDQTYRFVAVDYVEDGEETDPEFLARLRDRATRLPLSEGEHKGIDLRLIQR